MNRVPTFRLVTLGRLALVGADGAEDESLQKRRRKLAVLAVLALERRPVPRDTLVEMFWGDQEEERARHSLSDALSHLRRVLGRDAISLSRSDVSLAASAPLLVDALELLAASQARDHQAVVRAYGGRFLDGMYVPDAPSFEHWVERQRSRVESAVLQSCEQGCAALARARRWEECGELAARWLDVAPLSVDAALYRLNALKAPGTREADRRALEEFERLRARLGREYEMAPDRAVAELAAGIAARLREEEREAAGVAGGAAGGAPAGAVARGAPPKTQVAPPPPASRNQSLAPTPAASPLAPAPPLAPATAPRRFSSAWRVAAGAALALALALTALALRRERAPRTSPRVIAVLPFTVRGEGDIGFLRDGMADLLSTNFDGAGSLRSVDPRAVLGAVGRERVERLDPDQARRLAGRFGAGLVVVGDVLALRNRLRISAALYDQRRGDGVLARGAVEGEPAELFDLVDRLTRQLLVGYPDRAPDRLTGLAALTTSSLPALKAYLEGVTHYRAARYDDAFAAFERAARQDSTFALAHYQLSNTALWAAHGGWDTVLNSSRRAVRHDARLTPHARLLVEAYQAFRAGELDRAERLYRATVADYPNDVEAWYQLGDVLFHGNASRGRSMTESRAPFERVLALEPEHRGALVHLMRVALFEGRRDEAVALLDRTTPLTQPAERPELEALRAYVTGDRAAQERAFAALRMAPEELVRVTAMRVALFLGDYRTSERIARLLVDPARNTDFRVAGHLFLADLALARGRRRAAHAQLDSAGRLDPVIALEYRGIHLSLPFVPARPAEIAALRDTLERWRAAEVPTTTFPMFGVYNGLHEHVRLYLLGVLSARLGDVDAAARYAARLDALPVADGPSAWEARNFAHGLAARVRAHAAAARGRPPADALMELDRSRTPVSEGLLDAPIGDGGTERWLRAELLQMIGRDDEAYRWYASFGQTAIQQGVFVAPAAIRMGAIEERRGQRAAAVAHYRVAAELLAECDSEMRPLLRKARERLAALGG